MGGLGLGIALRKSFEGGVYKRIWDLEPFLFNLRISSEKINQGKADNKEGNGSFYLRSKHLGWFKSKIILHFGEN